MSLLKHTINLLIFQKSFEWRSFLHYMWQLGMYILMNNHAWLLVMFMSSVHIWISYGCKVNWRIGWRDISDEVKWFVCFYIHYVCEFKIFGNVYIKGKLRQTFINFCGSPPIFLKISFHTFLIWQRRNMSISFKFQLFISNFYIFLNPWKSLGGAYHYKIH